MNEQPSQPLQPPPGPDGGPVPAPRPGQPPTAATGDARVDAALAELGRLEDAPVSEHATVYDEVHRRLAEALTTLDGD